MKASKPGAYKHQKHSKLTVQKTETNSSNGKVIPLRKKIAPSIPLGKLTSYCFLCITFILGLIAYTYSETKNNDRTNFDDDLTTFNNRIVREFKQLDWETAKRLYAPTDNVRVPVTQYTHALDYQKYGDNASGHHHTSKIIFMITSVLVFFTVLMLSNWNIWVAALAMLFFGLNPMHVEAVAWITARKDQMMALMVFGTIVLYLGYVKTIVSVTGMRKFVLGLIFHTLLILGFLLAIFSKGMAVVLPVALVVMDRFLNRTWQWTEKLSMPSTAKFLLGSITEKAVLFGIMVYLGMQVTQEQNAGGIHVSLLNIDILRGSYGLTVQTLKYFFPYHGFMCAHIHNEYSKPLAMTCTVLVAVWIWSLWYFRKYPVYVFGMLFYFVFVGVIHYVPGGNNIMMAERYILIGSVGLSFPLCWYMGQWVKGNTSRQWIVGGVACIYFAFFIYNTTVRVLVWRSSVTLWEDVIEKRPTNATAYSRVATAYYEELDDPKTAIQNLEIGLKHTPKHLRMLTSYIVYLSRGNGNTDSIIQKSNTAIPIAEMRHDSVRIALLYYSRGTAYARKESDEQAIADLSHCLSFQTYDFMSDVYTNLGILHGEKGSIVLASSMFKKALLTDPAFSQTYKMWSLMFYKNNMIDSALAKCNMYLQHSKNAKDSSDALLMRENMFRK